MDGEAIPEPLMDFVFLVMSALSRKGSLLIGVVDRSLDSERLLSGI